MSGTVQITPDQLRLNFPAVANASVFTTQQLQMWLTDSYNNLNALRWGASLDIGAQLRTVHMAVLEAQAAASALRGATPGAMTGAVSSKGVGPANVSYDTAGSNEDGAGHWNLTIWGSRFIRMARLAGAGGMQMLAGTPGYLGSGYTGLC